MVTSRSPVPREVVSKFHWKAVWVQFLERVAEFKPGAALVSLTAHKPACL